MPFNRRSIPMLTPTGTDMNTVSEAVKADSYYGYTDGLHTIQVQYDDFVGRFRVEATLALEPTESDWFALNLTNFVSSGRDSYREFAADTPGDQTEAYTFQGNYLWLRVEMDRSDIDDGVTYDPSYGQISQVILSA